MRFTTFKLSNPLELSRKRLQEKDAHTLVNNIKRGGSALFIAAALAACGGGGGGGGGATGSTTTGTGGASADTGISETATGVASLSWDIPLATAQGDALRMGDLAGYRIYTGATPNNLQPAATISDGGTSEYTVTGLNPGVHYFAVTAMNNEGAESAFSNIESKTVN